MIFIDIENVEDIYMVHKTDFFPRNHRILCTYDGNRVYTEKKDGQPIIVNLGNESKSVHVPSHRHTVHFTLNCVVEPTSDGAGNWVDSGMAVIEPFKEHKEQFLSYGDGDSFTWGSVQLSNEAVLVVRRDCLNKIPEEEKDKWTIIVSDEADISKTVKEYLRQIGAPIINNEANDAVHARSVEFALENNLQFRDKAINFIRNNGFDGKSPINLSIDEVASIFNIQNDRNNNRNEIRPHLTIIELGKNQVMAPEEFYNLILANGFTIDTSGNISLKSDEEIYEQMKEIDQQDGNISETTFEEVETFYIKYMDFISEKSSDELTEFETEMIRREREKVKELREQETDSLNIYEHSAISRDNKRLLNTKIGELDDNDTIIVKSLINIPQKHINFEQNGYSVKYSIIGQDVIFSISPDDEAINQGDTNELRRKSNLIADRSEGVIGEEEDFIDLLGWYEFKISMPSYNDNETYVEFYSRIQNYLDGIESMMAGKKVQFGEAGAIVQEEIEEQFNPVMSPKDALAVSDEIAAAEQQIREDIKGRNNENSLEEK